MCGDTRQMSDSAALQHEIATGFAALSLDGAGGSGGSGGWSVGSGGPGDTDRDILATSPAFVSDAELAAALDDFRVAEAQCSESLLPAAVLDAEARRLGALYVLGAKEWLSGRMGAQMEAQMGVHTGVSQEDVARWAADLETVCATRRQTVRYIQEHQYNKADMKSMLGLVDVRAHYTVLDAGDLALGLLVAQALQIRHGFDAQDVQWAPYQLRKMESNNEWNSVHLNTEVYEQASSNMRKIVDLSKRLVRTGDHERVGRWGSAADALHVHVASQSLFADMPDFPPAVEWAATFDRHTDAFLRVPDVQSARDTRLLLRILRGDRSQRLISRRLFSRCNAAIADSTDRAGDCRFLQSFMEPAKHALVRSVMLGERYTATQYAFMRDETVRTGYIDSEKTVLEATLMLATPAKTRRKYANTRKR